MRIARLGLLIVLAWPLGAAFAQQGQANAPADQESDSLAAAARKAREEKKDQPKASKVWDNDNIPAKSGGVSVVGSVPAAEQQAAQNQQAGAADENKPAKTAEDKVAIQSELDKAKEQLENLKKDLDIAQRKYGLDQQTYYSKPEYSMDKAGAAALQDEKDQIDAKQKEVDDAQKKIDDLQAKLDSAK
jgi:hypothetical protein